MRDIGVVFGLVAGAAQVCAAQTPVAREAIPGRWKEPTIFASASLVVKTTPAEMAIARATVSEFLRVLRGTPILNPPPNGVGLAFDAAVLNEHEQDDPHADRPIPVTAMMPIRYLYQACATCEVLNRGETPWYTEFQFNLPEALLDPAVGDSANRTIMYRMPRRIGTNQGFPVYGGANTSIVVATNARPIGTPVTRGDYFNALITNARRETNSQRARIDPGMKQLADQISAAKARHDDALVRTLTDARAAVRARLAEIASTGADVAAAQRYERERASFTEAELRQPAFVIPVNGAEGIVYEGARAFSKVLADSTNGEAIVRLNKRYFDGVSRGRLQLLVIQSSAQSYTENEPRMQGLRHVIDSTFNLAGMLTAMRR